MDERVPESLAILENRICIKFSKAHGGSNDEPEHQLSLLLLPFTSWSDEKSGWLAVRDVLVLKRFQVTTGHFLQKGKWPVLFAVRKELR